MTAGRRKLKRVLMLIACIGLVTLVFWPSLRTSKGNHLYNIITIRQELTDHHTPTAKIDSNSEKLNATSFRSIPHIFHQVWTDEYIPVQFVPWIRSWKDHHPDWQYILWTDECAMRLVAFSFPEYMNTYNGYRQNIHRADAIRYFILYKFGGVYMDMDMESLRPLTDFIDSHVCIVSQEPELHASVGLNLTRTLKSNAFLACRSQHPFYKLMNENLPKYSQHSDVLHATGPFMIDKTTQQYIDSSFNNQIYFAPPNAFNPTLATRSAHKSYAIICKHIISSFTSSSGQQTTVLSELETKQLMDCQAFRDRNFTNEPDNKCYSNHHWMHTYWHDDFYKHLSDTIHITDIVSTAKLGSSLLWIIWGETIMWNHLYNKSTFKQIKDNCIHSQSHILVFYAVLCHRDIFFFILILRYGKKVCEKV